MVFVTKTYYDSRKILTPETAEKGRLPASKINAYRTPPTSFLRKDFVIFALKNGGTAFGGGLDRNELKILIEKWNKAFSSKPVYFDEIAFKRIALASGHPLTINQIDLRLLFPTTFSCFRNSDFLSFLCRQAEFSTRHEKLSAKSVEHILSKWNYAFRFSATKQLVFYDNDFLRLCSGSSVKGVIDNKCMNRIYGLLLRRFSTLPLDKYVYSLEGVMEHHAVGKPPISAKRFVQICLQEGIDPHLAASQAAAESQFGTQGLGKRTKNMCNIGNASSRNSRDMFDWERGLRSYCSYMRKHVGKTFKEASLNDFKRRDTGASYATRADYVEYVGEIARSIAKKLRTKWA